jgi:hypothetical protein
MPADADERRVIHDSQASSRPLVLLDVDGAINDSEMLAAIRMATDRAERAARLEIDVAISHGHHVAIPPELDRRVGRGFVFFCPHCRKVIGFGAQWFPFPG